MGQKSWDDSEDDRARLILVSALVYLDVLKFRPEMTLFVLLRRLSNVLKSY